MNKKVLIDQLSKSYIYSKNIIQEHELGISKKPKNVIDGYKRIVDKFDRVTYALDENDKYIIYNEVILGKKGEWYNGFISTPTYYRHRKIAYNNFLKDLKK